MEQAHLLGHFQVETTLKRLQESYYWRKKIEAVRKVIGLLCNTLKDLNTVEYIIIQPEH